jgi:hypothetical protein
MLYLGRFDVVLVAAAMSTMSSKGHPALSVLTGVALDRYVC